MRLVGRCEPAFEPSAKRRKLSQRMARYTAPQSDDADEQFLFEPGETVEDRSTPREEHDGGSKEQGMIRTSDREELIQCIKRGQKTTWVPKPGLEALYAEINADRKSSTSMSTGVPFGSTGHSLQTQGIRAEKDEVSARPGPSRATDALRRSLSALRTGESPDGLDPQKAGLHAGAGLSTPRKQSYELQHDGSPSLWQLESPEGSTSHFEPSSPSEILRRSRAPSLGNSLSSSFVMRIPTSPLVNATNNPTLDFSPRYPIGSVTDKSTRRRTMPPNAFDLHLSSLDNTTPNFSRPFAHVQSPQTSHPPLRPGHRLQRSLSSFTYQSGIQPQIPPWSRQRRPSLAADNSPRQRASMVGSFEESILRGRMSTPPSKPLDFVAQIGVMGKGNCPNSLKCPAHVTVPFPAVFYNYPSASTSRSISDDNPSPYVGSIDLEHNLKAPEAPRRRSLPSQSSLNSEEIAADITKPENTPIGRALAREAQHTQENRPAMPRVSSGGAYRVPQKGQLQVIIKNPNKTAVKLFLVPYDLEGMLPGMKTFVRQRSYSTGPILEATTEEKQAAIAALDPLSAKDILRYLIHLKFCCTGKGRFYLYDDIRVVFANRLPDGKEKLRNEVQLPEPRFSPHKPRMGSQSRSPSISEGKTSPLRRISVTPEFENLNGLLGLDRMGRFGGEGQEAARLSYHLDSISKYDQNSTDVTTNSPGDVPDGSPLERKVSHIPGFLASTSARSSPVPWPASEGPSVGHGFSATPIEAGHGLLSRKLRELNGNRDDRDE